jgi:hypothetical protein
MNKKFWAVSIIALLFTIFLTIILNSCGMDKATKEAAKVWEDYVEALKAGKEEVAKSFFTKESQAYFSEPDSQELDYWKDSKFTIIKEKNYDSFVKLQVLAEKDNRQFAVFRYLVKQDSKYLLQYPFLIFAKEWPVMETQHFIVHSQSFYPRDFLEANEDTIAINPMVLEEFYAKIKNLIGIDYPKRIDYYLCQKEDQAELLAGVRQITRTFRGSAVISIHRYDFATITDALTYTQKRPIDLLYYGIWGYAELQSMRVEKIDTDAVNFPIAKRLEKWGKRPILSLLERQKTKDESERQRVYDIFIVGGALIDYLIEKFGADKFRALYQNSWTCQEFENQILVVYNTNLVSLERELNKKYDKYFGVNTEWLNKRKKVNDSLQTD